MGDTSKVSKGPEDNFRFAFNDYDFSDRILHLEITPDNDWFPCLESKDSESSDAAKVRTLYISSPILAAKSVFFYKLFKNGMTESVNKTDIFLKINTSEEEAAFMELLRFMYGETALEATSFYALADLLIAADKFEVTSCMIYCVEMLNKFPMSLEHALFYLELPSSVSVSEIVKPLIDAAKQFVAAMYKSFIKFQEEAVKLPLFAIEAVLGSEGLQVESEDKICDLVLKWARTSYTELEERREILTKRLAPLIRFSNVTTHKLKEVLACADFDHEHLSKLVLEDLLLSRVDRSYVHLISDSDLVDISTTQCCSAGRAYDPHCVVFFDITKDKCAGLFPSGELNSAKFCIGGKQINLRAQCKNRKGCFELYVMTVSENCTMDFEISVMNKSLMEFESGWKSNNSTVQVEGIGWSDFFGITSTELLSDDSDYFINNVLRLKVEFTLKSS